MQISERGLGARQGRARKHLRLRGDLPHLVEFSVAMKDDVATGKKRRLCPRTQSAAESRHRKIVGDEQAFESNFAANDTVQDSRADSSRPARIDRLVHDMGGHRDRGMIEAAEGYEVVGAELACA